MMMLDTRAEDRISVLAPAGPDGLLACDVLRNARVHAVPCRNLDDLIACLADVDAVVIAEEALEAPGALDRLAEVLAEEPPWSDIPVIVLNREAEEEGRPSAEDDRPEPLRRLGNVIFLARPVSVRALVSAVKTALRARRRQYQVRALLQQAEDNVRARDRFLAMLGHELRNPLGAILYATELLKLARSEELEERQRATIERQTRLLSRIVDDLLDVSRVTTGKVVLKKTVVDLREVGQRCMQAIESAARAQHLTVRSSAPDEPTLVEGDSVRLEQILTNLLVNAVKYTPPGGLVKLRIERERERASIVVSDTGIGIDPGVLPRVFDLFAQAEGALDRSRGGLGIGLTLVRSLVSLHGGEVVARSEGPGKGSEFEVVLPLFSGRRRESRPERMQSAAERSPVPLKILLVEDNADIRESLCSLLELAGHEVECAASGPDGVRSALNVRPQVAIVDIGLPGFDGYEVARRIRSALGESPFLLALTGYGQPEDQRRATLAGFDRHLTKPVALESVRALLERMAGKYTASAPA